MQDSSILLCNLQDSSILLCNLQDSSILSCNLQDSSILSCNFQDGMVLVLWGSWCYSKEWVWNLRTKLCCIASGMRSSASGIRSRVSLQELDIRYLRTYNFSSYNFEVAEWLINRFTI